MSDVSTSALIAQWNADGRNYIQRLNGLIADGHEGRETPKEWPDDVRTLDQAKSVLALIEAAEREGRWQAQNPVADRAYEPFVDMLNEVCQSLRCVCILGRDDLLVCAGTSYMPGKTLHISGGQVVERPDILAAAMTRSHDRLLLVTQEGFSVRSSLDGDVQVFFPWPESVAPGALDCVQVSEDGRAIAFVEEENAVWLGQADGEDTVWTCVYPTADQLDEDDDEDEDEQDGEKPGWSDSMMHCALSPDGKFIAYGSQCHGHFIDRIIGTGEVQFWAEIGYHSEYPHYACFSDDSTHAALNSCHFYHGATVGVRLADVEGVETAPYEEDARVKVIDERLRVYAATWLPLGPEREGFALAGASYLDVVSVEGEVRNTVCFGSSASSIDYCPKTGLLAVASYSGFLHLYDPTQLAQDGSAIGYRPIHEHYRWVFWKDRAPFRW
jgi:hypothetical protein